MQKNITKIEDKRVNLAFYWISILITILTPLLLSVGLFGNNNPIGWWHSISASYYCNTKYIFLTTMSIIALLLFYLRKVQYIIAGINIFGILSFPTYEFPLGIPEDLKVGLFKIPLKMSGNIHCLFNLALFVTIIGIVIIYIIEYKKYLDLLLLVPMAIGITLIAIETGLHNNGDWSFHWITIIAEWMLFQSVGVFFYKLSKLP